jgi:hypothetical protein
MKTRNTSTKTDRRRFARVRIGGSVTVSPIPRSLFTTAHQSSIEDLSERGVRLSSPELFPADSRLLLDLEPSDAGAALCTIGRVVWAEPTSDSGRWQMGVAFSNLSASARLRLHRFVAKQLTNL